MAASESSSACDSLSSSTWKQSTEGMQSKTSAMSRQLRTLAQERTKWMPALLAFALYFAT